MIRKQMEHDLWSFETSHKIAETRDRMINKEMCEKAKCELLEQQIEEKYAIEAKNWLQSLTPKQLDVVIDSILDCDTFKELKQTVTITSTN